MVDEFGLVPAAASHDGIRYGTTSEDAGIPYTSADRWQKVAGCQRRERALISLWPTIARRYAPPWDAPP
jgi:hypothetical protein